jgi:predicted Fe-Mo cluster-binding NifX family protein
MKICIATIAPNLDSQISPVFGRAPYFLIVDSETEEFKAIENEAQRAFRGAGIAAAKRVVFENAKVVIAGMVGPKAQFVLEQSGIKVITGVSGTAKEALEKFKKGKLK